VHLLGNILLLLAFVLAALGAIAGVAAGRTGDDRLTILSKRCVYAVWACIIGASMILWHFILSHDFSNEYVAHYSDTKMPWYYLVASFWGGQKGSMLFWTMQLANFCALAVFLNRDRNRVIIPYAIATMMVIFLFFDAVLIFATNPFEQFLVLGAMPEGDGLNPLLQNPAMTFHPPTMLSAYAIWAVPFSFAIGALITGKLDDVWLRSVRRWSILGWFLLSLGNLFGGLWAYEELGWGGYWAWDPVENAAFMPWLTATAFLHSVMIQERRGILKVWNIILVMITFIMTIFGTFITRTGLIQSVHSFATGGSLKYFFVVFLCVLVVTCVALVLYRLKRLRGEGHIDSWLSREAAFVANNVLFVTGLVVVLWGTMFPKINESLTGREMSIGPPWFNQFMGPIGIALLALSSIGPLVSWRRATWGNFKRNFITPILWGAALTALLIAALESTDWFSRADISVSLSPFSVSSAAIALVSLFFSCFGLAVVVIEFHRAAQVRVRLTGEALGVAFVNVVGKARRRYGGYVVHLGIVLLFLGFAGSAFQIERDVIMEQGERAVVGDYEVRFDRLSEEDFPEKSVVTAHISVFRKGRAVGEMQPARFLFKNKERTNTTEVDIRSNIYEDFYLALVGVGEGGRSISLKVFVNPLIFWMWMGTLFLVLGTVIATLPSGVLAIRDSRRRRAAAAATATFLGAIALMSIAPATARAAPQVSDVVSGEASKLFNIVRCDCGGCGAVPISMCQPSCSRGGEIRDQILSKLSAGFSTDDIVAEVVAERGETALAYPIEGGINFLHWAVPAVLGLLGLGIGAVAVKQLKRVKGSGGEDAPTRGDGTDRGVTVADLDEYDDRLRRELSRLD
jgi:cytochrome c-type biogenesis protein CcmF